MYKNKRLVSNFSTKEKANYNVCELKQSIRREMLKKLQCMPRNVRSSRIIDTHIAAAKDPS